MPASHGPVSPLGASGSGQTPLASIQVLRALAALGVTAAHSVEQFAKRLGLPGVLPDLSLGMAGVDLFFVISGFIMVYASEPLFAQPRAPLIFALRRLARIVPLYWAISSVVLVYVLLHYHDLAAANISPAWLASSFAFLPWPGVDGTMLPLVAVGWTLNYEMFFYATFSLALLTSRRKAVVLLTLIYFAIVLAGRPLQPLPLMLTFWSDPIILEFVFGIVIASAFREGWRLPAWASHGLLLAALAAFAVSGFWQRGIVPRPLEWGVPAAMAVAALVLGPVRHCTGFTSRLLGRLGDASYALYLVHPLVLISPRWLFARLIDPSYAPGVYAAGLVVASAGVALIVHALFEKPMTRRLQRWLQRHVAQREGLANNKPLGAGAGVTVEPHG
ncbi:MAG: acyltransferase [Alphaproteobacteria bacterium]|nr:acyltransferase [Alphaproteobacteria bacterium]